MMSHYYKVTCSTCFILLHTDNWTVNVLVLVQNWAKMVRSESSTTLTACIKGKKEKNTDNIDNNVFDYLISHIHLTIYW